MTIAFKTLLNVGPKHLKPYVPGKNLKDVENQIEVSSDKVCKLSSNENPLGPSPMAIRAIKEQIENIYYYPDPDASDLKSALSKEYSLKENQFALGNGSDELITQLFRLYANKRRPVAFTKNSFPAYKIAAIANDVPYLEVNDINYNTNLDALKEQATANDCSLIFIANPNNPSGGWLTHNDVFHFMHDIPEQTLVVLDEAYFEYTFDVDNFVDSLSLLDPFPNLIILRTFSKAYGLAGLRVGYAMAHPDICQSINTLRLPFNVNALAQVAAIKALKDRDHLALVQKTNSDARTLIFNTLKALGFHPLDSASNSIMFDAGGNIDALNNKLLQKGIIARTLTPFGLDSFLRINTGTIEQNDYLITTLCQICEEL